MSPAISGSHPTVRIVQQKSNSTNRRRRYGLVTACAVMTVLAGTLLVQTNTDTKISAREVYLGCSPTDGDCLREGFAEALETGSLTDIAEEVVALGADRSTTAFNCHLVMHALGQAWVVVNADPPAGIAADWRICSHGLLHGIYESLRVEAPPSKAGPQLFASCQRDDNISTDIDLYKNCLHAVGHSLYDSYTDATLQATAVTLSGEACLAGSQLLDTSLQAGAITSCMSGVYMRESDNTTSPPPTAGTTASWDELLSKCRTATHPRVCAQMFAQSVLRSIQLTDATAVSFYRWCVDLPPGPLASVDAAGPSCAYFLGRGLVSLSLAGVSSAESPTGRIAACGSLTPDMQQMCYLGAYHLLLSVGAPESETYDTVCSYMRESRVSCAELRTLRI